MKPLGVRRRVPSSSSNISSNQTPMHATNSDSSTSANPADLNAGTSKNSSRYESMKEALFGHRFQRRWRFIMCCKKPVLVLAMLILLGVYVVQPIMQWHKGVQETQTKLASVEEKMVLLETEAKNIEANMMTFLKQCQSLKEASTTRTDLVTKLMHNRYREEAYSTIQFYSDLGKQMLLERNDPRAIFDRTRTLQRSYEKRQAARAKDRLALSKMKSQLNTTTSKSQQTTDLPPSSTTGNKETTEIEQTFQEESSATLAVYFLLILFVGGFLIQHSKAQIQPAKSVLLHPVKSSSVKSKHAIVNHHGTPHRPKSKWSNHALKSIVVMDDIDCEVEDDEQMNSSGGIGDECGSFFEGSRSSGIRRSVRHAKQVPILHSEGVVALHLRSMYARCKRNFRFVSKVIEEIARGLREAE